MSEKIMEYPLLPLLRKFIQEAKKGKYLQKNGKKIKSGSIQNYHYLELLLVRFSEEKEFQLRLKNINGLTKKQFEDEKKYWKTFYLSFTDYMYDVLGHYDNYVGRTIKLLRSFFNYLITEKDLSIGSFYKHFYAPSEDVEIIVLSAERLNYLIDNQALEQSLNGELLKVKDIFVFGCAVALRFSDLMALRKANLELINDRVYLKVRSRKTQTFTRVKLPEYAQKIIRKYAPFYKDQLLPVFNKAYMNKKIKLVMEHYGFTEPVERSRQRRGIPQSLLKKDRKPYRFCDAVTTHTMRRSAITTMLSLGMNEQAVRQISGHATNSKEFYRYVSLAQTYIDNEIDLMHQRFSSKKLEII